jgi:acetyl esterase/lipase
MAALAARTSDGPLPARGDWRALRETASVGLAYMATLAPASSGITTTSFTAPTYDGEGEIDLRWYSQDGSAPGSAVVYTHGGGMIAGSIDLYDEVVSRYVETTGVPFLSVEVRLAPEVTSPSSLAEDVFTGLSWLIAHAAELSVEPQRIGLMGDSGGGGPAAGAAILARDRGVPLARQILIYPMLDDRTTNPGPVPPELITWNYDNNFTGWYTLLDDAIGTEDVPPVAAPARLRDYAGLAAAYVEVGDLDIFRDEDISYALSLAKAGVPIELHVHPATPHGFDRFAPQSRVALRAFADRARVISTL